MEWILFSLGIVSAFIGGITLAPCIKLNFLRIFFAIMCFVVSGIFMGRFILGG